MRGRTVHWTNHDGKTVVANVLETSGDLVRISCAIGTYWVHETQVTAVKYSFTPMKGAR